MRNLGVGAVLVLACSSHAFAQSADIPDDRAIDVQTFEYAIGPKSFLSVADADVAAQRQLAVDALISVMTEPFKIYNVDENGDIAGTRTVVIDSMATMQLLTTLSRRENIGPEPARMSSSLPIISRMVTRWYSFPSPSR